MRAAIALAAIAVLSGCGKGENAPGPGDVTVGEARALDEAAQMLDERRLPAEALRPIAAASASAAPDHQ